MTVSQRLRRAAKKILSDDDSIIAAGELEGVLIDEYLGDERTAPLLEGLTLYAPGKGSPYVGSLELRQLIADTLEELEENTEPFSPT
jgi:hypothetical protein